jgi:hypothetical protein
MGDGQFSSFPINACFLAILAVRNANLRLTIKNTTEQSVLQPIPPEEWESENTLVKTAAIQ